MKLTSAQMIAFSSELSKSSNPNPSSIVSVQSITLTSLPSALTLLQKLVSDVLISINKPKLDYLTKVYQAANTPDKDLKEYVAEWQEMTSKQLDGAINKTKQLVDSMGIQTFEADAEKSPFGFSSPSIPTKQESFSASVEFKKIDEMSPSEAFGVY